MSMNRNLKSIGIYLALFALLAISFSGAIPRALSDSGGNQVQIVSETLSPDGTTLIVTVSATINDNTVQNVLFVISVSYDSQTVNVNKPGMLFYTGSAASTVHDLYAQATFLVPFQGPGHYLTVLTCYDAGNGAWLGSDWKDPREGSAL